MRSSCFVDSDNEAFYVPAVAYAHPIGHVSSSGMAMYGNGGLNTGYHGKTAYFGEASLIRAAALGPGLVNRSHGQADMKHRSRQFHDPGRCP